MHGRSHAKRHGVRPDRVTPGYAPQVHNATQFVLREQSRNTQTELEEGTAEVKREERTPQRRREGDLQYLQIAQGSEGSIFDAADVVAVQLPADERQKSAAGLQTMGGG